MNPLTNMKNVIKLSEQELYTGNKTSWHDQYRDSAWVFIGGLPFDLTEGDVICIFSQYGEIVNINLIRDKDSGKSKGFCFLCYEDQRSSDLAVDNFNGIKIMNRSIRVDHVSNYKIPKQGKKTDVETKKLYEEGCAPKSVAPLPVAKKFPLIINKSQSVPVKSNPDDFRETLADYIKPEIQLPERLPIHVIKQEKTSDDEDKKAKKSKKHKKKKKKSKKISESDSSSDVDSADCDKKRKVKKRSGDVAEQPEKKTERSYKRPRDGDTYRKSQR